MRRRVRQGLHDQDEVKKTMVKQLYVRDLNYGDMFFLVDNFHGRQPEWRYIAPERFEVRCHSTNPRNLGNTPIAEWNTTSCVLGANDPVYHVVRRGIPRFVVMSSTNVPKGVWHAPFGDRRSDAEEAVRGMIAHAPSPGAGHWSWINNPE